MSSCPSRAGEYRTSLGIGPGVFYSGACVGADGTTSELPVRMYHVYELLYQASTDPSCLDSAPLTPLSCLLFWDSFSVWYHLWRMTPRWRQVDGEKSFRSFFVRQLWRRSKPNRSVWVTDLPVRNKLTSTHHGIDFTSQHWQGNQLKSHTLPAQFIRPKSSPQREHSHQCLFLNFFFLN